MVYCGECAGMIDGEGGRHEGEDTRAEDMRTECAGAHIRRCAVTFWGCQFVFVSL